jgi:hypothetical protein
MLRFRDLGVHSVATATRDQSKTSFVKELLNDNPHGTVKAVNEAWAAPGKKKKGSEEEKLTKGSVWEKRDQEPLF